MNDIKMIIWDLDNTFWQGTLAENEVPSHFEHNVELVKQFSLYGIINSICSKNDFDSARTILSNIGIWDYFVFPQIGFLPKGRAVKSIIDAANLRPQNVLFIDDYPQNLQEVTAECPGILTADSPDMLVEYLADLCSQNAELDASLKRLSQYKMLEQRYHDLQNTQSNEDFLFDSHITVTISHDCHNHLKRIHQLILRTNQLNYTKKRLSEEETQLLFTDCSVQSGYVAVSDKYGDHGIVGCYAIQDGKVQQFAFSCRVLGMGIEQFVYAHIGSPSIEIAEPVACPLKMNYKPRWITLQKTPTDITIAAYGYCPLKPLWYYISEKFPNSEFHQAGLAPSICNLAAALRQSDNQLQFWLNNVNTLDPTNTFDTSLLDGHIDYLIITINAELRMFKYIGNDGSYFYSSRLTNDITNIFEQGCHEVPFSPDDLEIELSFLCQHLKSNTKLIVQLLPEVLFHDTIEYQKCVSLNQTMEQLAKKYSNIILLDIRKYATSQNNFWDDIPEHFNRNIGFQMFEDFMRITGLQPPTFESDGILSKFPEHAQILTLSFDEMQYQYILYIVNDTIFIKSFNRSPILSGIIVTITVLCNEQPIQKNVNQSNHIDLSFGITSYGKWQVVLDGINGNFTDSVQSSILLYDEHSYARYLDPQKPGYHHAIDMAEKTLLEKNYELERIRQITYIISELAAYGISIADYFRNIGVKEISVIVNRHTAGLVLPRLLSSDIKIHKILSSDSSDTLRYRWSIRHIDSASLDEWKPLPPQSHVLVACEASMYKKNAHFLKNNHVHLLVYTLFYLYTKMYIAQKLKTSHNTPQFLFVKVPEQSNYGGLPYSYIKPDEKIQHANLFEPEILSLDGNSCPILKDIDLSEVHIQNGFRLTTHQPNGNLPRICVFGGANILGSSVSDEHTIPSFLQRFMPDFRVINCSNYINNTCFDDAFLLYEKMQLTEKDIAVFVFDFWKEKTYPYRKHHWFTFEALDDPAEMLDVFPLFMEKNRGNYFHNAYTFTEDFNCTLARLIADKLNLDC